MTNIEVLENKISQVKKYLQILEGYKKYRQDEIENDLTLKGALERYLYLAIQSTIDLGEVLISFKKLRKPSTLAESFIVLREAGVLSEELTEKMVNAPTQLESDPDPTLPSLSGQDQALIPFLCQNWQFTQNYLHSRFEFMTACKSQDTGTSSLPLTPTACWLNSKDG